MVLSSFGLEGSVPWFVEGTIGISIAAQHLRDLIPAIEEEVGSDGTGIVVFKINSGGGLLLEIEKLSDVIENEYKPKFRVVSWIESAISAAAMTSHCIEEIYFFPEGNYGACTAWFGGGSAVSGRGWIETAYLMERISGRSGYDLDIMYAMMGHPERDMPLWVKRDQSTGEVTWFGYGDDEETPAESTDGATLLNPPGEVLTLNSMQAETWGFSRGTVNNLDDLATLMGFQEVNWVGKEELGKRYPVSKAEEINIRWREGLAEEKGRMQETFTKYQTFIDVAGQTQGRGRGAVLGKARRELDAIKRLHRLNNNIVIEIGIDPTLFPDWLEQQEELIRDIAQGARG